MARVVQKFGGTSVADPEKILRAAKKAARRHAAGDQVVVVVSAMGKQTDTLVHLAQQITNSPSAREMDMLLSTGEQVSVSLFAMALQSMGHKAVSLTGGQVGIRTDSSHTKARIQSISTDHVSRILDGGAIVIAAGFQGYDSDGNITTLGRGGSDTTAVALAAVLNADCCEIYTDVDGIYTTDPRVHANAARLSTVSHDEMLELASLGAGVMHSRSIEFAKKFGVPIVVRSSFEDGPGTTIVPSQSSSQRAVSGVALARNEARITVEDVPDKPGASHQLFAELSSEGIAVDMIIQNAGSGGMADISFTVTDENLDSALRISTTVAESIEAAGVTHNADVAKVSIVGVGMVGAEGVAATLFQAISAAGINVHMITTSEIKISVLVDRVNAKKCVQAAHQAFNLDGFIDASSPSEEIATQKSDPLEVVRRLEGMEDLAIEDCQLDMSQALVTFFNLPNTPGVAADVFQAVGRAGLNVDMIVQSFPRNGRAEISFTIPESDRKQALDAVRNIASDLGANATDVPKVAKLSLTGIGIRSHAGVADKLFAPLADAGVNIDLISTSEVRVNVIVSAEHGTNSLRILRNAFELE
jgi:aspartate kinase